MISVRSRSALVWIIFVCYFYLVLSILVIWGGGEYGEPSGTSITGGPHFLVSSCLDRKRHIDVFIVSSCLDRVASFLNRERLLRISLVALLISHLPALPSRSKRSSKDLRKVFLKII